jgi:hypothetical protein
MAHHLLHRELPAPTYTKHPEDHMKHYETQTWSKGRILPGIHRPLARYRPALALTVLRYTASQPDIVVGVRDPDSNPTHPNVVSTPTRRIQPAVAGKWLWYLRAHRGAALARRPDVRDEVDHIFSRKLGLANHQELDVIRFRVESLSAAQGISVIGEHEDGSPRTENLTMFNAVVRLDKGGEHLPSKTASYRPLAWASVPDFITMTQTRDAGHLGKDFENILFCSYGLCLQTSVHALSRLNHDEPGEDE